MRNDPNVAQWITAGAALVALIVATLTIRENRRVARRTLTYHYVLRINSAEFIALIAQSVMFLGCHRPAPGITGQMWREMTDAERQAAQWDYADKLQRSPSIREREKFLKVLALPNLLEEIAGMYNQKLLDPEVVKTQLEYAARSFWNRGSWWFDRVRSDPHSNVYQELAVMLDDLERRKRPFWHRPEEKARKRRLVPRRLRHVP